MHFMKKLIMMNVLRKLCFVGIACVFIISCSTERKQRDILKLNWFEISADARNKTIRLCLDSALLPLRAVIDTSALYERYRVKIDFIFFEEGKMDELLEDEDASKGIDVFITRGQTLDRMIRNKQLKPKLSTLSPHLKASKMPDMFQKFSEQVETSSFSIPILLATGASQRDRAWMEFRKRIASNAGFNRFYNDKLELGQNSLSNQQIITGLWHAVIPATSTAQAAGLVAIDFLLDEKNQKSMESIAWKSLYNLPENLEEPHYSWKDFAFGQVDAGNQGQ